MNKNLDPKNIDEIISKIATPKRQQEEPPHKKAHREIIKRVFG